MTNNIIKKITFFGKDATGYFCELNKIIKTKEDVEQFNEEKARKNSIIRNHSLSYEIKTFGGEIKMGLLYAKNLRHAKRKLATNKNLTSSERRGYVVKKSPHKSEEKGYNLYSVTKRN